MTAARDNMKSVINQYGFLPEAYSPAYMVLGNEFEQALKQMFPADKNTSSVKVYHKVFEPYSFDKIDAEIIGNIIVANLTLPTTLLIPVNNGNMHYILLKIIISTELTDSPRIELIDSKSKIAAEFYDTRDDKNLKIRDLALSAVRRALNIANTKKISAQIIYRGNQSMDDGVTCSYQVVKEMMVQQKQNKTLDEVKLCFARAVTNYGDALTLQQIDVGERIHKVVALRSCIADNSYLECYKKSLIAGRDLGIRTAHTAPMRAVEPIQTSTAAIVASTVVPIAAPTAAPVFPTVTPFAKESFWVQHPYVPAAITIGAALTCVGFLLSREKNLTNRHLY